jgi:hypothetical protein
MEGEMPKEPTTEELLTLRRASRVLHGPLRKAVGSAGARALLDAIADDEDAPQLCEGCDEEGVYADEEGCYTCRSCAGDGV